MGVTLAQMLLILSGVAFIGAAETKKQRLASAYILAALAIIFGFLEKMK